MSVQQDQEDQQGRVGPFVTYVERVRPDGAVARWDSRRHRKHPQGAPADPPKFSSDQPIPTARLQQQTLAGTRKLPRTNSHPRESPASNPNTRCRLSPERSCVKSR